MTAELIVMNKHGIALAADSAVTISMGGAAQKVYNTANKLFTLSKYEPVGVMTYNNAELMGVPWEVLIKRFRSKLGNQKYSQLQSYIDAFLNFLKTEAFDASCIQQYVISESRNTLSNLFKLISKKTNDILDEKEKCSSDEEIQTARKVFDEVVKPFFKNRRKGILSETQIEKRTNKYLSIISKLVEKEMDPSPFTPSQIDQTIEICLHTSVLGPSRSNSGIVFAGFGTEEYFPVAKSFTIYRVIDGEADILDEEEDQINFENKILIKAFAQRNETTNFMDGISEKMNQFLRKDIKKIFDKVLGENLVEELITDGLLIPDKKEECSKKLRMTGTGIFSMLAETIDQFSFEKFTKPVIDAVEFFSPKDMASMAETLVNLESFRQQVSLDHETVGGPIDIAVITKGDGFIWIKRKHYFEPSLNHHFFSNYYDAHDN